MRDISAGIYFQLVFEVADNIPALPVGDIKVHSIGRTKLGQV